MSFLKVKPSGWAAGEVLTSAQMNTLDTDHANALDKTGDTIGGAAVIEWGSANYPRVSSRTLTRMQHLQMVKADALNNWQAQLVPLSWSQNSTSAVSFYSWLDNVIDGATLTAVRIKVVGVGGHAALPGTMPTLKVWRNDITGPAQVQLGSTATDSSANTGAYQTLHEIAVTGLTEAMDESNGRVYHIEVTSEGGANAIAGFQIFGAYAEFTTTQIRPGG